MSNNGTHFKTSSSTSSASAFHLSRILWWSGSAEIADRRLSASIATLYKCYALLMEFQLDSREWVHLLPLVQANLNHNPAASLHNRAPAELFTLLPPSECYRGVKGPEGLVGAKDKRRRRSKAKSEGAPCTFSERDFVLWSRMDSRLSSNKLLVRRVGPFEVARALTHSFMICHLVRNKTYNVHGSWLKFYADSSFEVNDNLIARVGNQGMVLEIEQIKQHHFASFFVSWVGLQDEEDSWKPLSAMATEVSVKVSEYLSSSNDEALKAALTAVLAQ
ncbi:Hypothetical protein PHPALM_17952 [Phytophthora palmivora]|uniref:Chromo domain-containing protein n=1 Tax=Phytophthora palmivora TaxID=4796 RepID=A0A2P4XL22_9STRA|nr:Hypothetical protein PHPALM_17952 [Phytophthora palmivora]